MKKTTVMNCCSARIVCFEPFWLKRSLGLIWLVAAVNPDKIKSDDRKEIYVSRVKCRQLCERPQERNIILNILYLIVVVMV